MAELLREQLLDTAQTGVPAADVLLLNETPIIDSSGVRDRPGRGSVAGRRSIDE